MRPYQFAVLRYVHNAASAEFVNVGILLSDGNKLHFAASERYGRLSSFFVEGFDGVAYQEMVKALRKRVLRLQTELTEKNPRTFEPKATDLCFSDALEIVVRRDSSAFQWSEVMAGIHSNPQERLGKLMDQFVYRHEGTSRRRRDDADIWRTVKAELLQSAVLNRLERNVTLHGAHSTYTFKVGWMNGVRQVLEPISLDCVQAKEIVDRAIFWSGRLAELGRGGEDFKMAAVVAGPLSAGLERTFQDARAILEESPQMRRVVKVEEFSNFIPEIEGDLLNLDS